MRKQITSLLLTLAMLLSLVPTLGVTASAADGFVEVSTYEQLENEVKKGEAKVKLVANIDTTNDNGGAGVTNQTALVFFGNNNILDLNGHTLKLVSNTGATFIYVNKDLTIKDSSGTSGRINFEYGPNVMHRTTAIYVSHASNEDIAHLTVESGTLSSTESGITLIESIGNLTINGGKFYAPYEVGVGGTYAIHTIHKYNDNAKTIINGGEINGVVFIQRDDSAATGTPNYGGIPVQIKGGTFKQAVQLRWTEKGKPSGNPTEFSPAVEIAGGIFEKRVNKTENDIWGVDLSTKLTGGTFKDFPNSFGLGRGGKSDHEYYSKSLGNSIIVRGKEIRTSCYWSEADWFKIYFDVIHFDGRESDPVTVIPNAWGMKSVTLDGKEINYFKDWKGAVEKMDNSTAHTLTFEWYPLAEALKDAGYSYDAKCEHYISGSTAVQKTETIDANKTSHTVTIPKGADPKVYSFDLQLNLEKNGSFVGIYTNDHIVKLVVSEAPEVKTLTGKASYINSAVFGQPVLFSGTITPGVYIWECQFQWQRSTDGGSTWKDIPDATDGQYIPGAADMGENVRIRVVITKNGYLGEIVSTPAKVSKAANDNTPALPNVTAQKNADGTYTAFQIKNFRSDQEYVYTTSAPTSGNGWPTGGTPITSATVDGLNQGSTCYIFTRYKESDTHQTGSKVSSTSVLLDEITMLNRVILTDANGRKYNFYGSGNIIYIKKGESMTLTAKTNPVGATTWSGFTFKSQYGASAPFTVTAPTGPVVSGSTIPSVTIRGDTVGTGTLAAEYGGYPAPQSYGTWRVHVYENVSDIGTAADIIVAPSFPDLTMRPGETMPLPEYAVSVYPKGALDNYALEWRIIKVGSGGAAYSMRDDHMTLENGKIEPTKAHTGSEKTRLELVAVNKTKPTNIRSFSPSVGFYITVGDAPLVELTGLTLTPKKVDLEVGKTCQLSAVKEPANAEGSLTWTSSKPAVAAVDKSGKVTAKGEGTATITVTCGTKSAACTVTVSKPLVPEVPGTSFTDVPTGAYYEEAVGWAVEKGITKGTSDSTFTPDGVCTRAQAVTFLWRAAGSPAAKAGSLPFADVKAGSYYDDAVRWAVENGVTVGTSATTFSPNATCSRAQIVTFLWRAQKSPAAGSANPFDDVAGSAYYADAVQWAVQKDITKGTGATAFSPDANCIRAQIVTFLYRSMK